MHTTAWDQLWGGDETERLVLKLYVIKKCGSSLRTIQKSSNLDISSPHGPQGSEDDPECIVFTLNTLQITCISDIL